ncbi:MAG: hypothetical protein R3F11_25755 [Verrucomicrobiales bacterium]
MAAERERQARIEAAPRSGVPSQKPRASIDANPASAKIGARDFI